MYDLLLLRHMCTLEATDTVDGHALYMDDHTAPAPSTLHTITWHVMINLHAHQGPE